MLFLNACIFSSLTSNGCFCDPNIFSTLNCLFFLLIAKFYFLRSVTLRGLVIDLSKASKVKQQFLERLEFKILFEITIDVQCHLEFVIVWLKLKQALWLKLTYKIYSDINPDAIVTNYLCFLFRMFSNILIHCNILLWIKHYNKVLFTSHFIFLIAIVINYNDI